MFLATINQPRDLLYVCYIGHVTVADLQRGAADLEKLLLNLKPGFHLLADLSRVDEMDVACVQEIGKTMELLERHQVGQIVRVVPDADKDIGSILLPPSTTKSVPGQRPVKPCRKPPGCFPSDLQG